MYIKVHVFPGSRDESFNKECDDLIIVHTKEPAEGNRANKRVIELITANYPGNAVRLVSGHQSPHKIFSIGD